LVAGRGEGLVQFERGFDEHRFTIAVNVDGVLACGSGHIPSSHGG
jgi:hypothetical protein